MAQGRAGASAASAALLLAQCCLLCAPAAGFMSSLPACRPRRTLAASVGSRARSGGDIAANVCSSDGRPRAWRNERTAPRMAADGGNKGGRVPLPSLTQICYGALLFTSGQGLVLDAMQGAFDRPVVLDVFLFVVSALLLKQTLATVDYAKLDGRDRKSLARDAGDWAMAGEVPTQSKCGKYQVATFAGGCFWGTELHFQRMPGVVATCVGYTQGGTDRPNYQQVCSGICIDICIYIHRYTHIYRYVDI